MPGRPRASLLSVAEILSKSQEAAGAHNKYARMLWETEANDSDGCYKDLVKCLSYLLTIPLRTNANAERALRFIATFTAQLPPRKDSSCSVFVQDLIADLVLLSAAANKTVRIRACSLLASIMQRLTAELQDDALDELQTAMLARLKDKEPQVRLSAAAVLERLAEPGEDEKFTEDPVTQSYRKLLEVEQNKDVRKVILGVIPLVPDTTLQDVLQRAVDVSDVVRRQAFVVLANKCSLGKLSGPQRALLLRRGLKDRVENVANAARALLQAWLVDDCNGDVIQLLKELDVRSFGGEAEVALNALHATNNLQLYSIASGAESYCASLRSPSGSVILKSEEAFFWRWVCETLRAEGVSKEQEAAAARGADAQVKAAEASDRLEALEAALPESVAAMMELIAFHATSAACNAFTVNQLLQIANCMDLSDSSGRRSASELLWKLMVEMTWSNTDSTQWGTPLLKLARQVFSGSGELLLWLLDVVQVMRERQQIHTSDLTDEAWVQMLSITSLLLCELPSSNTLSQQALAGLLDSLIFPALSRSSGVRAAALRCLGLFCLLSTAKFRVGCAPTMEQKLPVSLLRAALTDPNHDVRVEAGKMLCDLALVRGPKLLDACHTYLIAHPTDYLPATCNSAEIMAAAQKAAADSQPLLDLLLQHIDVLVAPQRNGKGSRTSPDEQRLLGSVVVEGFCKLLMHQSKWPAGSQGGMEDSQIVQALVRLLVAYVDPATEEAAATRQCLSVFFPAYASFCGEHHRLLGQAVIPAARRALGLGSSMARSVAPNLLRFALQLLQSPLTGPDENVDDHGYSALAEACLSEILACHTAASVRSYAAALLKLAAGLPLQAVTPSAIKTLRVLTEKVKAAMKTGIAARDVAAFGKKLAALDPHPSEALSEEAVAQIMQRAMEGAESSSLPFHAASRTSVKTRGQKKPAVVDASTSEESDEEESSEDDEEGGMQSPKAVAMLVEDAAAEPSSVGNRTPQHRGARVTEDLDDSMMSPTI